MTRIFAALLAPVLLGVGLLSTPVAGAADACADFGGAVEQDGLCRVHEDNPEYILDMSFPVDFPTQDAVNDFLSETRSAFLEETNTRPPARPPYGLDIKATLDASDTTRSVTFAVYQNVGGAHPNSWYRSFNYDTVRQRPIAFDDLFAPGVRPLDSIFPIVQRELESQIGVPDIVLSGQGTNPENYQNFAITPVQLIFFFDRGSLMAGAAGAHSVRVPRSQIPPLAV